VLFTTLVAQYPITNSILDVKKCAADKSFTNIIIKQQIIKIIMTIIKVITIKIINFTSVITIKNNLIKTIEIITAVTTTTFITL
jgi:hypothetical protein